jgi:very-short-patch-repair endonuclease
MSLPLGSLWAMNRRVDLDGRLRELARRQHGVVSRRQAAAAGCSRAHLGQRLISDWELVTPRVLRLVGTTETFEQRCMAGVLDAGHEAVVQGPAAARIWGLPGFDREEVEVTRRRRRARRSTDPVPAHEPRSLPPHHRTVHRGVPVTTVERTVFDLMSAVRPGRAERALDNALARRLTTLRALRAVGKELCRKGRTGSALYRRLLAERGVDFRPLESGLEATFLVLVKAAGLPEPERQVDLGGSDGWIGRVDFYVRAALLILEVDSEWFHSAVLDVAADARRDGAFEAAGFEVLRITEDEIRNRPSAAVSRLRAVLAQRVA